MTFLFTLLHRFTVVTMGLAFLVTLGIPGNAQGQIFDDQEYENYYDPFYDPYFGTNGGYDYDDNFLTDRELRADIMRDLDMSPFLEGMIFMSPSTKILSLSPGGWKIAAP